VYSRGALFTDTRALAYQSAEAFSWPAARPGTVAFAPASIMPLVSLGALPQVGTLDTNVGANAAFFGDVAELRGPFVPASWRSYTMPQSIAASNAEIKADKAWVDARLDFIAHPEIAQAFGGAVTTSARALLPITGGTAVLAYVKGRLLDQSARAIARSPGRYSWIFLPETVRALKCEGRCVVALKGRPPPLPANPLPQRSQALPLHVPAPWLLWVHPLTDNASAIRFNTAYDPHWIALRGIDVLPHFRMDAVVNAWIVPPHNDRDVALIEWVAALQSLFEVVGVAWVCWLLARYIRQRRNANLIIATGEAV